MSHSAPNVLLIMADQLAPQLLPFDGSSVVQAPNLAALAERAVRFDHFYCNSPICAPARHALLSGQLCSTIGAWDNSSEVPTERPTIAHYLRRRGYRTCLGGKMHFVGPDQLHGFEERLTTDICPADFQWTQYWDQPGFHAPYHHDMANVANAGLAERSLQQDYDYDASYQASRWLYDHARRSDREPFFLVVSFTHPHDPFITPRRFWDLYEDVDIPMPEIPFVRPERRSPHELRLYEHYDRGEFAISEIEARKARRAYFGNISFLDERIGEVLSALRGCGMHDDTLILFTSDHGEMLGERGLWYKMTFHEWASRVPLLICGPGVSKARNVTAVSSHVDLLPTLLDLAGGDATRDLVEPVEGQSLVSYLDDPGHEGRDMAIGELYHDVVPAPYVMVRRGRFKYLECECYPPQLFDLESHPQERFDLSSDSRFTETLSSLAREISIRYDIASVRQRVLESQRRRRFVHDALSIGRQTSWDFQPFVDASKQYYRDRHSYHNDERRNVLNPS